VFDCYICGASFSSQVKAFWSLTLYNNKSYLADNPINRYAIGGLTPGLKNNSDGSLDIYIQHDNPGKDKESNWLPTPAGDFSLNFRPICSRRSNLDRRVSISANKTSHIINHTLTIL
jgi:hypothetical protein